MRFLSAMLVGLWAGSALAEPHVLILGEVHDNAEHHRLQAEEIAALAPVAVIWEMLSSEQAAQYPGAGFSEAEIAAALAWEASGWPDFAMYYPIFVAAGDALHLGAELNRSDARRAMTLPLARAHGPGAERFGLDEPLPEPEAALRSAEMVESHCGALPEEAAAMMVGIQRLRDARLAQQVISALTLYGSPVAVITGNGHARADWGVPALLARAVPQIEVETVGMLEAEPERPPPFDRWHVTEPAEREDPCAGFR